MRFNHIKAPEHLKNKTISLLQAEQSGNAKRKPMKIALIAACIPMIFVLTAFGYSLFSGIDGDELAFNVNYKGNGIVEIAVQNLAKKDLQFDEIIKLQQWSTNKEIFELELEMPKIESGKSGVITIQIPEQYINQLEIPLPDTDWYHFLLTTNNFMFGQTWTASLTFAEPISTGKEDFPETPVLPIEDNTNQDDISTIKNSFNCQKPLSKVEIPYDYNDYETDGEYIHAELDLVAELGTEIYPLTGGTVLKAEFDEELGWYMVIDHGDGLKSKYMHCNELLKKQGDTVAMDDAIATVGKTGMATGPLLAFSITLNDVPVNPKAILLG